MQLALALAIWLEGLGTGSLATVTFAYWLIFYAVDLFVLAVRRVVTAHPTLNSSGNHGLDRCRRLGVAPVLPQYPFGWQRLPVLLTFARLLFVVFVAVHVLTESVKHNLDPVDHHSFDDHHHENLEREGTPWSQLLILAAILSGLASELWWGRRSIGTPPTHPTETNADAAARRSFAVLTCLVGGLLLAKPCLSDPLSPTLDPYLAIAMALATLAVTAGSLGRYGRLLLQAAPPQTYQMACKRLEEVEGWPGVLGYHHFRLWATTPEHLVGSVEIRADQSRMKVGPTELVQRVRGHLTPLVQELTVQVNLEPSD
ncbi:hypothetical protein IWQ60_004459 [Tieghemiomyces parasiticus]|uniref:Cation efflux protein transmembrane domain-containing protein n=1 Tax=Tieghemiomyces parasiticus TaxID=78921 RepID=A0A9W8A862_9FUNG|nr:hypothetical protein IWQ60_004459 [Tieghemiomyces parasiticus]